MSEHLTAAERETIIVLSDDSATATITTHQRRVVTKLNRNPLAVMVADLTHGTSVGASYTLPVWAVTFRTKKRKATAGNPGSLEKARLREKEATPAVGTGPRRAAEMRAVDSTGIDAHGPSSSRG